MKRALGYLFLLAAISITLLNLSPALGQTSDGDPSSPEMDGEVDNHIPEVNAIVESAGLSNGFITGAGKVGAKNFDGFAWLYSVDHVGEGRLFDWKPLNAGDESKVVTVANPRLKNVTPGGILPKHVIGVGAAIPNAGNANILLDGYHEVILETPARPKISVERIRRPLIYGDTERCGVYVVNPYVAPVKVELEICVSWDFVGDSDREWESAPALVDTKGKAVDIAGQTTWWQVLLARRMARLSWHDADADGALAATRCTATFTTDTGKEIKRVSNEISVFYKFRKESDDRSNDDDEYDF